MGSNKGVSLIALIITIAVLSILAVVTIQNGLQRTNEAKLAKHNENISLTQEEVESYYYYKGAELPVINQTPYDITSNSTLLAEITKNNEQNDNFYILDLSKLGKTVGKEGSGTGDDIYILSSTRHNVYYVKGTTIKGLVYHGLITKNDIKLALITGGGIPTTGATSTPTNSPTPTAAPSYGYNNPKVPSGFSHVSGTWDNGFTIEDGYGNQFVWVPVGDFTLGAKNISIRFERTAYKGETFDASHFYETNDTNLQNMTTSASTYGGFYIAKYEMSQGTGSKAQSKADVIPWTSIDWNTSKAKAESMDTDWSWNTGSVESYLCYGTHWDTALQWIIQSGAKISSEVTSDSTTWGNYYNATFTYGAGSTNKAASSGMTINTGVSTNPADRHMVKGIYDLAGNVWEWTMENYTSSSRVSRGGYYNSYGSTYPAAYRYDLNPIGASANSGFRCVLYLK